MKRIFFLFLTLYIAAAHAQCPDWKETLRLWQTADEAGEAYDAETMEMLEDVVQHKINLNQTSREELEQLPFLSAQQVEGLLEYVYRYGPLRSLSELQMVTALDYYTRQLLSCFVTTGKEADKKVWPRLSDVTADGSHTLMLTGKVPFYERKGDKNGYLGYPYRHDLRYQFNYHGRIKFGLTAAQDAGEPFFANCNTAGYDHYNYYLQLRDMGRLKALNLGMYRVQLGMGLVINTGFHLGKMATLQSLGRSTRALTAHASRSQDGYLRGAAATVQLAPRWQLTAFASHRPIDATLNDDGTARTLITGGYHRTPTEIAKKNNTHESDLGISAGWRKGTGYVNANIVYTHLDRPLRPQMANALYRQYAAEGSDFANMSLDYGYANQRLSMAGETALNRQGAVATLHSLSYRVAEALTLMAIHRYYDKRYTALHSHSFSEGSGIQNEHGIYVGASWRPSWTWLLQGYADYAHFGQPRYQVSAASDAFDAMLSARHTGKRWSTDGRYRLHIRQRDNSDKTRLINRTEHQLRLGSSYALSGQWSLRTQANAVCVNWAGENKKGVMLSQQASWQTARLRATVNAGWFHTDDYDSRIYQYEPSVLYDQSFPMYYGHGLHYALTARADISNRLMLMAKVGVTDYFNRSTIGSGLQQVNHSSMTDLLLQLRLTL